MIATVAFLAHSTTVYTVLGRSQVIQEISKIDISLHFVYIEREDKEIKDKALDRKEMN